MVCAVITCDEPLTRLHFWHQTVLVDPVTAVAGLTPDSRVILLSLFLEIWVKWLVEHIFSELLNHVALVHTVVDVVVMVTVVELLLTDNSRQEIANTL